MRLAALTLILAATLAAPALADPAPSQPAPEQPQAVADRDAAAAQAQALSMRHKAEQDARIAAIACAAGDTSKCASVTAVGAQAANTTTPPKAPKD